MYVYTVILYRPNHVPRCVSLFYSLQNRSGTELDIHIPGFKAFMTYTPYSLGLGIPVHERTSC